MKKYTVEDIEKIPKDKLLKLINVGKKHIKKNKIVIDMFDKEGVDLDYIDLIPIYFKSLDVSAQTIKGVIYLNYKLAEENVDFNSYLVHELTHFVSQITGTKATKNTDDLYGKDYLESPEEIKAFKNQIQYIDKEVGKNEADKYVNNLIKYHKINNNDKNKIKKKLT